MHVMRAMTVETVRAVLHPVRRPSQSQTAES